MVKDIWNTSRNPWADVTREQGRVRHIIITLDTTSDAFYDDMYEETARILKQIAHGMETHHSVHESIKDSNGNTVGKIEVY